MTLAAISIPGFNNGISQQAPVNRRPDQGSLQTNGLGTLVDGLQQRPGTDLLAVLATSNATNGVKFHTINRDTDERFIVLFTGDPTAPIEIFDLSGIAQTVQYGTLNQDGDASSYSANSHLKGYALPWLTTDLVTNGGFTDWTADNPDNWTVANEDADNKITETVSGIANIISNNTAAVEMSQTITVTANQTYKITFDVTVASGGYRLHIADGVGDLVAAADYTTSGQKQFVVKPTDTSLIITFIRWSGGSSDASIDNVEVFELDTTSDPSTIFKAVTVADNTFVVNRTVATAITADVDDETNDYTVQTFADLPGAPADGETATITGDDVSGFDNWYVQFNNTTGVWNECIKPGESLGRLKGTFMPHRIVKTGATTFTFAPCVWDDRAIGDVENAPNPSFVGNVIQNVFFFKNRLAFLSEDNVIMSRTGGYYNFYPETALDVLDSDPIDASATSKQVENLRSVAIFNKSLIVLADQQQFDFGSGDQPLSPTTLAITPTTRFNICPQCEPVTAGPNVYFVCPKTDWATIREYYIQPESLLNDAADITAHAPAYVPMGHIEMAACNSLDMLLVHSDADADSIYLYKYFWSGEQKAQASWSQWTFNGDILGMGILGTIAYFIIVDADTSQITLESMELETTVTGSLSFRIHADRLEDVAGTYDSDVDRTSFSLGATVPIAEDMMVVVHPTTGRPIVDAEPKQYASNVIVNGTFDADIDWTKGTGWTISGGDASCDGTQVANSDLYQENNLTVSAAHRVRFTLSNCTAGGITPYCGLTAGTQRTTNGVYEEIIICDAADDTFYMRADSDFVGDIDDVVVEPIATTTDVIEVDGDYSGTTYHIGRQFEFRYRLSPWYLKDGQGLPRLQGRLQVRTLVLNYENTGYFEVEVAPTGRDTMTHVFSGVTIGVSIIGSVSLLSGEKRFTVLSRNTEVDVDIVSTSYLPVAFQSGSWEGVYYPRGRE